MAARHADKIDTEGTSGNESIDDSDDQDVSDDSSYAEDPERSSSVDTAERDDKNPNGQELGRRRFKARSGAPDIEKTRQDRKNNEPCIAPAIQEAINAVVKKGMSIRSAAKQNNINFETLRSAVIKTGLVDIAGLPESRVTSPAQLRVTHPSVRSETLRQPGNVYLTIKTGYQPRTRAPTATITQIDAAVQDIVERGMAIYKAAKLHRTCQKTLGSVLKERNLVRGKFLNPQTRKAAGAVAKKGMTMQSAAKPFRIRATKARKPSTITADFQPQRKVATKGQVNAAVKLKDVMESSVSVYAASKLHKTGFETLRKARNLTKPTTKTEMAVRAVVDLNLSSKAAGKQYGMSWQPVQEGLRRRGYIFEGITSRGKWAQPASLEPLKSSSAMDPNSPTDGNPANNGKEWTDAEEEEEDTERTGQEGEFTEKRLEDPMSPEDCPSYSPVDPQQSIFPKRRRLRGRKDEQERQEVGSTPSKDTVRREKERVHITDNLPDQEIEQIVDVRTQRQYLVKWQGEEEATWVDEDVFVGLTNLAIK